jgi:hypothetical protein
MARKRGKKNHRFLKFLLISTLILITLIITFPLIAVYSAPFILDTFFERHVTFEKFIYQPHRGRIQLDSLTLIEKKSERKLLSVGSLAVDIDLAKTLTGNPTVSSIRIDSPYTFIEKHGSSRFASAPYLPQNKSNPDTDEPTGSFTLATLTSLPLSFDDISIKSGIVSLVESGKTRKFITDLNMIIPGFATGASDLAVKPVVSAKIFDELISLTGKTSIDDDMVSTLFRLKLNRFSLEDLAPLIPDIAGVRIVSGTVNADISLLFKSSRRSKPELEVTGTVSAGKLRLLDTNNGRNLLQDASARADVTMLDPYNGLLDISSLELQGGRLLLVFGSNNEKVSLFFKKRSHKSSGRPFKVALGSVNTNNLNIQLEDSTNNAVYNILDCKASINNYMVPGNNRADFTISARHNQVKSLKGTGTYTTGLNTLSFDRLTINDADLSLLNSSIPLLPDLFQSKITMFDGSVTIADGGVQGNGSGQLTDVSIVKKITASRLNFDIDDFNLENGSIRINSLQGDGIDIPLPGNRALSDCWFSTGKTEPVSVSISVKDGVSYFTIIPSLSIDEAGCTFFTGKKTLAVSSNRISASAREARYISDLSRFTTGTSSISLEKILVTDKNTPVLRLDRALVDIDRLETSPLQAYISGLSMEKPFLDITIDENRRLYLMSLPLSARSRKSENQKGDSSYIPPQVELEKAVISEGLVRFRDRSLKDDFSIQVSSINGTIEGYPSRVQTSGRYEVSGTINNRNPISSSGTIEATGKTSGVIRTSSLSLPAFSPYTREYTGHVVAGGNMDLDLPYSISKNNLTADIRLNLKKVIMRKIDKKTLFNLGNIIPYLEDADGVMQIQVPIRGQLDKPDIDLRDIFFSEFTTVVSNLGKPLVFKANSFIGDDTIEVLYFKAGSRSITDDRDSLFSNTMKDNFSKNSKHFILEGYVDRTRDEPFIKREKLESLMLGYDLELPAPRSSRELELLRLILTSISGRVAPVSTTRDELEKIVLEEIEVTDLDWYSLSYSRIRSVMSLMNEKYNVPLSRIAFTESSIFSNPYLEGSGNSLVVVKSGRKSL